MNIRKKSFYFLTLLFVCGCSVKRVALKSVAMILQEGSGAFYEESDLELAKDAMPSQLKLLEVLLKNDPQNPALVFQTVQGFGAYSFLFLEEDEPQRTKSFYERGWKIGQSYLSGKNGDYKKKDAPILFWTAYCWAGYANLNRDDPEAIADLPKIEKMMLEAENLSPGYFYGGADIFLGSYYGSRPKILGGDLDQAKAHFEKAFSVSKRQFLMAQVLFARNVAIPAQDRELYHKVLTEVLEFPLESFPEQRLSNEMAKRRAKRMLERIDEYF